MVPHFNCGSELTAAGNAVQVGITGENPVHTAITLGPDRSTHQHDHSQMQARWICPAHLPAHEARAAHPSRHTSGSHAEHPGTSLIDQSVLTNKPLQSKGAQSKES